MSVFRSRLARRDLCCEQVMPVAVAPLSLLGRPAPKPMYPLPLPFEPKEEPNIAPAIVPMEVEEYPPKEYPKPGTILSNKTGFMPPGYLVCDGSTVSRTAYPILFSLIGTYYGEGDGVTTFHLPQLSNTCDPCTQYIIKYDVWDHPYCPDPCADPSQPSTECPQSTWPSWWQPCGPTGTTCSCTCPTGLSGISISVTCTCTCSSASATGTIVIVGPTGPQGPTGDSSSTTSPSSTEQSGETDTIGTTSTTGPTGPSGSEGSAGVTGPTGPAGPAYTPPTYPVAPTGSREPYPISPSTIQIQLLPYPLAYIPAPGTILYNTFNYLPKGYLACDGAELLRADYTYLFDMIGTYYGEGDGVTTFNIPNLQDNSGAPTYRYMIRYDLQNIPCVVVEPDLILNSFDLSNSSITFT